METQKTIINSEPVKLSDNDQEAIISFVKDAWDKGKRARKKYEDHWKECEKAYNCEVDPIDSPELDWMSNRCLPWAYDASDSWFAHIHSTTIPKNDQVFTISGRTEEDHPGADIMQEYMEYRFGRNKFDAQLGMAEKDLSIRNHTALKVYWREDTTVEYNWVDEPVIEMVVSSITGNYEPIQTGVKKVKKPEEKTTFNNVWIDRIDLDNFVFYPIHGDFDKTTRIHETYKFYEDFMSSADKTNYFNLDKIKLDDEQTTNTSDSKELAHYSERSKKQPKGLNIKEAWIHRIRINDKVYRNYVATVVNDKYVVRFQPFPSTKSPFVFMALRRDGDCLYGTGLNSKGLDILTGANKIYNSWLDEANLTKHQSFKYYDDGVFNPYNVVRRPGAMIQLSGPESVGANLVPLIDDPNKQNQALQDLAALKVEFETVTVPKVVKGMIEVGRDATATEITQAQTNSNGKMHIDAYNINAELIKPVLELCYQAIYDRVQIEMQGMLEPSVINDIQMVTQPKDANGNPTQELPILPLPEVDIKIVGYQNIIRKQEQLASLSQAIPQFAQSPAGRYLKWGNLAEDTFTLMNLDKDRLLMTNEEQQKADEQASQQAQEEQQLLIQQEMMKFQLQKEKQEQDYQINLAKLEIERLKAECDCQAKQAQQANTERQQAHQETMGAQKMYLDNNQKGKPVNG